MEASPMSLFEKFIKEAYGSQYVIPVYQRSYTWRKNKQVTKLLEDIEKILSKESKKHFIGTIVYVIIKTDFIVRERAVVDGQQRLVTMFLIAHALRKIATDTGEGEIAKYITSSYLENVDVRNEYRFRLRPAVSDDNAYTLIAEMKFDDLQDSDSKIWENFCFIEEKIRDFIQKYSMIEVFNAVRQLYVVRIELDENDDAQQIFESINSTGERLNTSDLIRNFIMMNKNNETQEEIYNNYWYKLETIFKGSKMDEFIRIYLATKNYVLVSSKELYDAFKEYWSSKKHEYSEDEILKDLLYYAKHYDRLYYSNNNDQLGEAIYDFRKMQSDIPAPFAIEMLEISRKGLINDLQLKEIIILINTYLMRRYLAGQNKNVISRSFSTYLKNVINITEKYGYENIVDVCRYVLIDDTRQKSTFMPDDEQVIQFLSSANAYVLQHTKWLLEKIENYNNPIKCDASNLSIEHIMPQKANSYWQDVSGLSIEDYEVKINQLGNLTLAAKIDNSKMQNFNFDHKKNVLKNTSHLKLNEPILNETTWTIEKIDNRTNSLIKKILTIFPYIKSNKEYGEDSINRNIFLNRVEISAEGYLNKEQTVTVYQGSIIRFSSKPSSSYLQDLREDLLEKEIMICEDGIYKFAQDYTFNSTSASADFIIGGSNNGWDCWKDSNGDKINDTLRYSN